jgi:hypothetical protein
MRRFLHTATVALLCTALLCPAVFAATPEQSAFSAIQGVSAQTLSTEEMKDISGQLNAYDIAAALFAEAANLAKYPKLQAEVTALANYTLTNAAKINAAFQKLGILTPCLSKTYCPAN